MKMKVRLTHKDESVIEVDIDSTDALFQAAIIIRNGRYYVYQGLSGQTFNIIKFQEVEQPYQVNF